MGQEAFFGHNGGDGTGESSFSFLYLRICLFIAFIFLELEEASSFHLQERPGSRCKSDE